MQDPPDRSFPRKLKSCLAWLLRWAEHPLLSHRLSRHVVGAGAVALVLGLIWSRSVELREQIDESAATALALRNDDDVQRMARMSGGDWPLVAYVRRHVAPGTPVSIPWVHRAPGRIMKGFWIALLPDYPVRPQAEWSIIFIPRLKSHHEVIVRGQQFALVRARQ